MVESQFVAIPEGVLVLDHREPLWASKERLELLASSCKRQHAQECTRSRVVRG